MQLYENCEHGLEVWLRSVHTQERHTQHWVGFLSTAKNPTISKGFLAKLVCPPPPPTPAYAKIHMELQGALNSQDDLDGVQWLFFSMLQQNT